MMNFSPLARRLSVVVSAGLLLLSASACSMRDCTVDTEAAEESAVLMLAPAERKTVLETRAETAAPVAEEPPASVSFCLTGDVRIDDSIITDAANRATDGRSYSFVRMYTGVFRNLNGADIAYGSYSAANCPIGAETDKKTPIEALAALADIGYDILDTSAASNDSADFREYGVCDLDCTASNVQILEKNGLTVAFLSMQDDAPATTVSAVDADVLLVSVQWTEDRDEADKQAIAQSFADAGADVILGNGDTLGTVTRLTTKDGREALVAYSLGNLLATSTDYTELCGGILEFTAAETEDGVAIEGVTLSPTVVRYTGNGADYQLFLLAEYHADLAIEHSVAGMNADTLIPYVRGIVPMDFLDPDLRG